MNSYYLDTSAIAKHYHVEIGTPKVDAILAEPDAQHFISRLSVVELQSALAKKVRMGNISEMDFQLTRRKFMTDIANGNYKVIRLLTRHLKEAERLLCQYATTQNLRTLDAVQLAVAIDTNKHQSLDYFVCADTNLCRIAATEGLTIINPEN